MRFSVLAACVVVSSLWAIGGCKDNKPPVEPPEPKIDQPKLGVPCTVQFRRDALGYSGDKAVAPMETGTGVGPVSLSGVIVEANEQWIVLDDVEQYNLPVNADGKHPMRTVWIRFDNILLIMTSSEVELSAISDQLSAGEQQKLWLAANS